MVASSLASASVVREVHDTIPSKIG